MECGVEGAGGPGGLGRLCGRTVKHVGWAGVLWIVLDGADWGV